MLLFKAVYPLLAKSSTAPKFIVISSTVASLTLMQPLPATPYGVSKVGLNYIVRRIHTEHKDEGLIAFPLHPGKYPVSYGQVNNETHGEYLQDG